MHSVWRLLKMYVDFSSERFSLCILFTFIKCCPAQYFIFIVASRPSWQHSLYEKHNKTKQKESKVSFWESKETRKGRCGCKNEQRSQAEAPSLFCHQFVSCQSGSPSPPYMLTKLMWKPGSGSALTLLLCSLKNLGGFCEIILILTGKDWKKLILLGYHLKKNCWKLTYFPASSSLHLVALCNAIYTTRVCCFCAYSHQKQE